MLAQSEGRPKIIARFRPLNSAEGQDECVSIAAGASEVHLTAGGASHCFTFDDVLVGDFIHLTRMKDRTNYGQQNLKCTPRSDM